MAVNSVANSAQFSPVESFSFDRTLLTQSQTQNSGALIAQTPTQAREVVTRTVDGRTVRFFLRDGVLHMSTEAGVQTGSAARTAFSSAVSRSPSLIGASLRTFGRTALTTILTEALFPQSVGDATIINSPTHLASQFLQEAANSDTTGSLVYEQQETRDEEGDFSGYAFRLYNRHTGVVIAEVSGGQLWTNPNLNENGTFTLLAPPADLTAEQTNGVLGSYNNVVQPEATTTTQVTNTPTLRVNERPLTLTAGRTSHPVTLLNYASGGQSLFTVRYTAPDGQTREFRLNGVTSFESASAAVNSSFAAGFLEGLSRVDNAAYTIPDTNHATTIHHVQIAGGESRFFVSYDTPAGPVSFVPILNAGNISQAGEQVRRAFIGGELPGLSQRFDASYTIPGTTYQTTIEHVVGAGDHHYFRVRYKIGGADQLFTLNAQTVADAQTEVRNAYANGTLPGLDPAQSDQPLLPPAPDYPLLPPGRHPIPDNLPTTPPDDLNAEIEPWDPSQDPWADEAEPEADAGGGDDEQPPINGGNGGNGGGGGGTPPASSSPSESDPNFFRNWLNQTAQNWNANVTGGTGSLAQRWSQFMSAVGATIRTVGKGLLITNGVGAAGATVFYGGLTERRTSQTQLTPQNAFAELQQLQRDPDAYITGNYDNGVGGIAIGDVAYNVSGHLLEVNLPDGTVYHFRRVPEDLYNALKQAQAAQGNNSDTVFVNEVITDRAGNRVPVWVEIRPPYRTEPLRDANFNVDVAEGPRPFSGSVRINGSIGPLEGFRPHIDAEGTLFYRYDIPTTTTARLGLPSPTQGFGFGVRQQDTTIFSRFGLSANAIDVNALRVRDLTDPNAFFSDRQLTAANGRLYVDIGNRNRIRADVGGSGTGSEALPDISSGYIRARETGFIEIGLGADFLRQVTGQDSRSFNNGAGTDSINGYLELQGYAPDLRGQLGFGSNGQVSGNGTELKPIVPLFEIDPAIQVSTSRLPDLTPDVPGLVDGEPWTSGQQSLGPNTVWALNVSPVTGANVPDANTVRNHPSRVSVNFSDGSAGYSADIGGKRYLALTGRNEVFDITGATPGDIRNMRYDAGNLVANGNFIVDRLATISVPNLGSSGRIGALSGQNAPSVADLQDGENVRTVETEDGLSFDVSDLDSRSYARVTIDGETYVFDVTGQNIANSVFVPGSTASLVPLSRLNAPAGGPSVSDIITRGDRSSLSDGRAVFFYDQGGQQYALYSSRNGTFDLYDVTGYDRNTIGAFLEQL